MQSEYHTPVLLHDCIKGLNIRPDGVYVDVTFGGGGHSRAILEALGPKGKLIAFDRDQDARANLPDDERLHFIPQEFRYIKNHLKYLDLLPVDGILADLGVSSHQFDEGSRGFSIKHNGPLDMRMDQRAGQTAAELLNTAEERDLAMLLKHYGEVAPARKAAKLIVQARERSKIETTQQLREIVEPILGHERKEKVLAQIFQALRIAVNNELLSLEVLLTESVDLIRKGGRLVVIAYHSLEDRPVKNYMRSGSLSGQQEKDLFGVLHRPFKPLNKRPIIPTDDEIQRNTRARSARLRIAERT